MDVLKHQREPLHIFAAYIYSVTIFFCWYIYTKESLQIFTDITCFELQIYFIHYIFICNIIQKP